MMTYEEVRGNKDINTYIVKADQYLKSLGFTEHSFSHVTRVAETADYILRELDYSPRERGACQNCRIYARYWQHCK